MSPAVLETLVKLAAAGTSGVCVVCVVAAGWVTLKLPDSAPPLRYSALKTFMRTTLAIAVVSATTTGIAGYWDYKTKAALRDDKERLTAENQEQAGIIDKSQKVFIALSKKLEGAEYQVANLTKEATILKEQKFASEAELASLQKDLQSFKQKTVAANDELEKLREFFNSPELASPPEDD